MRVEVTAIGDSEQRFVDVPPDASPLDVGRSAALDAMGRGIDLHEVIPLARAAYGSMHNGGVTWSNIDVAMATGRRKGRIVRTNR